MINRISVLVLLLSVIGFTQQPDPDKILEKVKSEFEKIEDYQVDVKIKVDISFLKTPDREATIYYKKPDKFHIDSENFTMLPKSGLNFTPLGFLNYKYASFYVRQDTINGKITSVIKVIPIEGNIDVILSTLWIDTNRNIILKVESSRKPQGTFNIDLDYIRTNQGYWLPSSIVFSFTLEGGFFPGKFDKDKKSDSNKPKDDTNEPETGKVYLTYSNYKVNIGLPDSVFEEKKSTK